MSNTKKLVVAALLVAIGVVLSPVSIPVGVAKVFPVQHLVNLVAAVLLGPVYGVLMAFVTSLIRVTSGTGSLLAFPGSMIGACCAGLLYKRIPKISSAFVGEVFGTGILGALAAYPVAAHLLSREMALFAFVIPFSLSLFVGASMGLAFIQILERTGLLHQNGLRGNKHEL